jgi:16S rRNA (adenine1518-N6/adenine1519-N6)-dimethyltransferase
MAQWVCKVKRLLVLPPQDFTPAPKIFSAFVQLTPWATPAALSWEAMEKVTQVAFQQRRKMLRASLKPLWPNPLPILEAAGIEATRRPETLTVQEVARLASFFS